MVTWLIGGAAVGLVAGFIAVLPRSSQSKALVLGASACAGVLIVLVGWAFLEGVDAAFSAAADEHS